MRPKKPVLVSGDSTTICPGSLDPFYIVTKYMKWVKTSWTHRTKTLLGLSLSQELTIIPANYIRFSITQKPKYYVIKKKFS